VKIKLEGRQMNKIIILRGNCGSGKSTTAVSLQKKLGKGTLLVAQDTVRREMLWVKDEPQNKSIELLKRIVEFGCANCEYTILEGILYSDIYKSLFESVAELYGKQIFAYYLDSPFEETVKRQKKRLLHNKFDEIKMREYWHEKDYIGFITEKTIDSVAMNTDEIINEILIDIGVATE
jgi:adenylylsulfate kinase-like enzyme